MNMNDLHMPVITTLAAGVLGLVLAVLSAQVVAARTYGKVDIGSGEDTKSPLFIAIRCQANFAEYVPLTLLVIGLIELRTGPTMLVKILAAGLVLGRLAHPFGMRRPAPNPFRAGGFVVTMVVLAVASVSAVLLNT
jgi:uncharacterized membrane protein YecN with MAPEG domain